MSEHLITWGLGALGALILALGAIVALLARTSFRLGGIARDFHHFARELKTIKAHANKVPVLESELAQTKALYQGIHSDIKHLLRRSSPGMNGE